MNAPRQSRLIRSASLGGYIELVRSLGRDPHALLRQVGLSARLLDDPEALIPLDASRELLEISSQATATEDFALRLAAGRDLADLGPISLVLKEEATPRQALDTLCRYLKLINSSLITRIEDAGSSVIVREDLVPSRRISMRQPTELAIGVMYRILRELIGPAWRPIQVCFTHRAPRDVAAHRAFFGRAVGFNQDFNGIVCSANDLAKPRAGANPATARFAREYLERALERQGDGRAESCRDLILALLPGGRCTADQVARHLRIDRRTLHRHLVAEGLSFSAVLDQVRSDAVLRHLRDSDLPLGEISGLLGFAAPSGFSHWFRARFGSSVSEWRRANEPHTA
jgi:AraC-like DNA-binding protein